MIEPIDLTKMEGNGVLVLMKGNIMKDLSDREVMEFLLAGKVIFAFKAISAGLLTVGEAAALLDMNVLHLMSLFTKLGLDR